MYHSAQGSRTFYNESNDEKEGVKTSSNNSTNRGRNRFSISVRSRTFCKGNFKRMDLWGPLSTRHSRLLMNTEMRKRGIFCRCRAKMAHTRQSRPDSGLDPRVKVLESFSRCSRFARQRRGGKKGRGYHQPSRLDQRPKVQTSDLPFQRPVYGTLSIYSTEVSFVY